MMIKIFSEGRADFLQSIFLTSVFLAHLTQILVGGGAVYYSCSIRNFLEISFAQNAFKCLKGKSMCIVTIFYEFCQKMLKRV